ncbi:hypothetical protein DND90_21460 [Pseudomonas syringae pv. maculicola]|nr:hypothetical protein DND90_21460 [Pseudomonas syringae pv. maculicola]
MPDLLGVRVKAPELLTKPMPGSAPAICTYSAKAKTKLPLHDTTAIQIIMGVVMKAGGFPEHIERGCIGMSAGHEKSISRAIRLWRIPGRRLRQMVWTDIPMQLRRWPLPAQ